MSLRGFSLRSVFKKTPRSGKCEFRAFSLKLIPACARNDVEDQTFLQYFIGDILQNDRHCTSIGQDVNAQLGNRNDPTEYGEPNFNSATEWSVKM